MRLKPIDILLYLQSEYAGMSPKLRVLADYVLADPDSVQLQSITDLAVKSCTSETTIFRFCQLLGFSGYAQFKMALAIELSQPKIASQSHLGYVKRPLVIEESETNITKNCAEAAIAALEETVRFLDDASLNVAVDALHAARIIYIVGVAASSVVGHYLSYRLLRLGKSVIMYEDTHLASMQAATAYKTADVCWFIVSSSGSSKEVTHIAKIAFNNEATVIGLSNVRYSPLSKVATSVLVAANPEGPLSGGAFASKVGAMLIIDSLIMHLIRLDANYVLMIQKTAESTMPLLL